MLHNLHTYPTPNAKISAHKHILPIMEKHVEKRTFHAGQKIFLHGDEALNVWFVLDGWVKLLRQTPDGKETILNLCSKDDVFGDEATSAKPHYATSAYALCDNVDLAYISTQKLKNLAHEHPEICSEIMYILNEHAHQNHLQFEQLQTLTAAQRLGCFMLRLYETNQPSTGSILIPIEKHVLASYLGMKPETLSRSQMQLKDYGVHVNGAYVEFTHIEKLLDFVCSSCSETGFCTTEKYLCSHSSSCNIRCAAPSKSSN